MVYGINYAPEPTGTGKYTAEMAEWLVRRGYEVDAIVAPPHYPSWKIDAAYTGKWWINESHNGVNVFRARLSVPKPDAVGARGRIKMETTFSLSSLRYWIPRLLRRRRYDVVIGVCPPMQIGLLPYFYRAFRGVPWVFHIQDFQVDAAIRLGVLDAGNVGSLLYKVENFFIRRASVVSTITEPMRQRAIEKGAMDERTWLFPNWADITYIKPRSRLNTFRTNLGISESDTLLLYSGNFGKKQGLDLIVRAADRLRDRKDLHFVVCGSGADAPRVQALAAELDVPNLRFLPLQPWERVPDMLAAADIHLVVQRREAADLVMPSKLTNILAAGRPSIATADPGTALHQVLTDHEAGLMTPPEELDPFVDAIQTLAADPALRDRMGRNARAYAERYLDKEVILRDFEQKLINLVAETRKRGRKKKVAQS
ncbi:MAG: WcaI family glycosyltransferase [Euryarchaeota archaeon]|nr:WcaI family glycosyltransferase [Euryarchaeota archaeon]